MKTLFILLKFHDEGVILRNQALQSNNRIYNKNNGIDQTERQIIFVDSFRKVNMNINYLERNNTSFIYFVWLIQINDNKRIQNIYYFMSQIKQLREELEQYKQKQIKWKAEEEQYIKKVAIMQQEINKLKTINNSLLKKAKHKRTSSEEHTFIFNQTNISSYFPMIVVQSNNWSVKASLKGHLDSVRALYWHGNNLISGGDDCLMRIWEKDQPIGTIRQHCGPIYSICGNKQLIFTGGAQGFLRCWTIYDLLNSKSPHFEEALHRDSIWQLAMDHSKKYMISSSADGTCKLLSLDPYKQLRKFEIAKDIPTSVDWLKENKIVVGYVHQQKINVFDVQRGIVSWDYTFQSKQKFYQPNKIIYNERFKMIASGHEDKTLKFLDPNSNKIIKTMVGHSDAVTSVGIQPDSYQLISCGHDGSMRVWDLRKYKCTHDVALHMRKYDQSAICLSMKKDEHLVAIGGADAQIKLLSPDH